MKAFKSYRLTDK